MFGRKGNYSTLEGDSHLQDISKERESRASRRINRKAAAVILAGACVIILVVVIVVPIVVTKSVHKNNENEGLLCAVAEEERVDCYPEKDGNASMDTCHSRGCCWIDGGSSGAPYCFFPNSYGYSVKNVSNTNVGIIAHVQKNGTQLPYSEEVMELKVEAYYETNYRLRVKVCVECYW